MLRRYVLWTMLCLAGVQSLGCCYVCSCQDGYTTEINGAPVITAAIACSFACVPHDGDAHLAVQDCPNP